MSIESPARELKFTKMQGAGNDFVVINNLNGNLSLEQLIKLTPSLCDRKYGVGADGLLALSPSDKVDYTMVYRNADGSDAGMCGNGARCLAAFAVRNGFDSNHTFEIHDSIYSADVTNDMLRTSTADSPRQGRRGQPATPCEVSIAFPIEVRPEDMGLVESLELIKANAATEHVVTFVQETLLDNEKWLVETGRRIRKNETLFPTGTNVNFVSGQNGTIKIQTYERGVEYLTLACGTGAIASAISWHHHKKNDGNGHTTVPVQCKGGMLSVTFRYNNSDDLYTNIILKGPAQFVFDGTYQIP